MPARCAHAGRRRSDAPAAPAPAAAGPSPPAAASSPAAAAAPGAAGPAAPAALPGPPAAPGLHSAAAAPPAPARSAAASPHTPGWGAQRRTHMLGEGGGRHSTPPLLLSSPRRAPLAHREGSGASPPKWGRGPERVQCGDAPLLLPPHPSVCCAPHVSTPSPTTSREKTQVPGTSKKGHPKMRHPIYSWPPGPHKAPPGTT